MATSGERRQGSGSRTSGTSDPYRDARSCKLRCKVEKRELGQDESPRQSCPRPLKSRASLTVPFSSSQTLRGEGGAKGEREDTWVCGRGFQVCPVLQRWGGE